MTFCNDLDLLSWEPNIFRDAVFASQLLLNGSGDLAGSDFTIHSGSLSDSHVEAGAVVVLSGSIAGSYPIVSVSSSTQLVMSAFYGGLVPPGAVGDASPVGTASNLPFAIRTFGPQRKVVSDVIARAGGVELDDASTGTILNAEALRRVCALGSLQMIYSALAAASSSPGDLTIRTDLYERMYRRALHQTRVEIDLDGDGKADVARHLGVLAVRRV